MFCTYSNGARGISAKRFTLATASVAALMAAAYAQPARAQAPGQTAQADVEEVVVTATRIVRDGYEAPTPTTVLSAESLSDGAPTNIADYVNTLPSLAGSTTPRTGNTGSSGGTTGLNALNLRALGAQRTLVLLDGRRVVPSAAAGTIDVSDFPQSLVSRVDVVTGGASASWGSDAVAGVVNFVLDSKFVGLKGDIQGGVTTYGDDRNAKVSLTAGVPFAGDRAHFIISADYAYQDGVGIIQEGKTVPTAQQLPRPWYIGWKGFTNPNYTATNGQPNLLVLPHVSMGQAAPGGIITSGPLKNIMFGPGGVPFLGRFDLQQAANAQGGDWAFNDIGADGSLDARLKDQHLFTRLTYDVSDTTTVFAELSYGYAYSLTSCCAAYKVASLTIRDTNPFIPASILAAMQANKVTTLQMGSWNADVGPLGTRNYRTTAHETVGINGRFDFAETNWRWNAYVTNGLGRTTNDSPNQTINSNYLQAIQAVRDPATGAIVCADRSNGCVPWNIFGIDVNSQAAEDYINGMAHQNQSIAMKAAAISFNGEPLSTWAGPVSTAFGVEWRRLKTYGANDPISEINNFFSGNFHAITGAYSVVEGYFETVVPLAKDTVWAKAFDITGAVRATDYSVSGFVTTWKVGASYSPIDEIRLRAVRSRDIRAPSLVDLFTASKPTTGNISDSALPGAPSFIYTTRAVGNLDLKPENSDNTSLGVVIQPKFFPGFSLSLDYYKIAISGAIGSFNGQQIVDQCYVQNVSSFCQFIVRRTPGAAPSTTNPIEFVNLKPINFQTQTNKGLDIEASYRLQLAQINDSWDGDLTLRTLWTNVMRAEQISGLPSVPPNRMDGVNSGSIASWRGVINLVYDSPRVRFGITERYVSAGVLSRLYLECASACPTSAANGQQNQTINYNQIPGATYTDLSLAYKFGEEGGASYQAYFTVNNLLNKSPPPVATINGLNYINNGVNANLYDTIGRMFHLGMRFKM